VSTARSLDRGSILLGKYRVESVIGRGGMGVVVKAHHLGLHEEVAIKMLRDDIALADETIARFVREAQAAIRLKSEHIARINDVGTFEDGKPYMVMELLQGQDIGQLLAERGRLSPSLAIDLVIQACEALAEAHSIGIVHRDIKPTNLFLSSYPDGTLLLKVLDFGISKAPGGEELSLTQTWSMLGSPAYMSPEQMRSARNVDARTDIWSLGAVLYEAVEGHPPFPAQSFSEMCVMVAVDSPTPMQVTPPALAAIVARCLAKLPDDRYRSVGELARELAPLAREPARAHMRVDRMFRMLGRGPAAGSPLATPPIGVPFALATPPIGSLHALPATIGGYPVARPEPRAPALTTTWVTPRPPVRRPPPRHGWLFVASAFIALAAVTAILVIAIVRAAHAPAISPPGGADVVRMPALPPPAPPPPSGQ
jgi:serine/threonine protein kinase